MATAIHCGVVPDAVRTITVIVRATVYRECGLRLFGHISDPNPQVVAEVGG
jgi:hypothetical protein